MSRLLRVVRRHMCLNYPRTSVNNPSVKPEERPYNWIATDVVRNYRLQLFGRIAPNTEQVPFQKVFLQRNEVECRILKLLHQSELVDIRKFNFHMDLRKDLGLDSLNITALLTEIEQEFTIVFEDRVFEGVKYLEDLVKLICRDEKAF